MNNEKYTNWLLKVENKYKKNAETCTFFFGQVMVDFFCSRVEHDIEMGWSSQVGRFFVVSFMDPKHKGIEYFHAWGEN